MITKQKNKKVLIGIMAAVILLLGIVCGSITIAGNTPERRADKYLDLGDKYLNELNYEQALVAYQQVLEIEPKNLAAYKGAMLACEGLGDKDGMESFYADALDAIESLQADELASVYDTAVEIYLYADAVYPENHEAAAQALERSYDTLGGDERIVRELIEEYDILAEAYIEAGEKEQEIYKKIAEKNLENAGGLSGGEPTAEPATEPTLEPTLEPTPEPTPEPVKYVEEISFTFSKNESEDFGSARGGSITVKKDGKWGAVDYEGKVIVPFEYDYYVQVPDNQGRFALAKSVESEEIDPWSGETYQIVTYEYFLFDNQGQIVYQGMDYVRSSGGMYITWTEGDEGSNLLAEYHSMDGSVLASMSNYSSIFNGFYDGICYVGTMGTDIAIMDLQGNITWRDNPGEWYWYPELYVEWYPISTINHGYYVLGWLERGDGLRITELFVYDERDNKVAEFDYDYLDMDENGKVTYGDWRWSNYHGYYVDGFYFYNYGSEMVFEVGEKNVLIDFARNTKGAEGELDMDEIVLAVYDQILMADEKYWLVQSGENWGYIDHEGREMAMFEGAGEFSNGYALVKEDGEAWLIDESFQKLQNLGAADEVSTAGEIYVVISGDKYHLYRLIN